MSFDPLQVHHWVAALALSTPRIAIALTLLPMFTRQTLGGLPRAATAAALAIPVTLVVERGISMQSGLAASTLALLLVKEACVGLLLGILIAIPFWVAEAIGFIVDNQRGAAIAALVNPMTQNESSPFGIMLYMALVVCFFMSGGMEAMLKVIYESYSMWPVSEELPRWTPETPSKVLGVLDRVMYLCVLLAGPMIVLMLLSESSLAIMSMFAPQLQVFPLAMGIKSAIALFVLLVYAPLLLDFLGVELREITSVILRIKELIQ